MKNRIGVFLAFCVLSVAPPAGFACLWDTDTLEQERSRFPSTLELITGKFLRHSQEFYSWRAKDRQRKLDAGDKTAAHFDDLAVALDKLGRHAEAIQVMKDKETLYPGQYETLANLGTFHIHAGDYTEGAKWIAKAIEVNPNAHFGREKFQLLLVEYLLDKQASKLDETERDLDLQGFAGYLVQRHPDLEGDAAEQLLRDALKGVQGMMRFGNHDSPILLEALGDLLIRNYAPTDDGRRLAARAFLRAADHVKAPDEVKRLRAAATKALSSHDGLTLAPVESKFRRELAEAEQWHQQLIERERQWIENPAIDPEAKFHELYQSEPSVGTSLGSQSTRTAFRRWIMFWAPLSVMGVGVCVFTCWRMLDASRRDPKA